MLVIIDIINIDIYVSDYLCYFVLFNLFTETHLKVLLMFFDFIVLLTYSACKFTNKRIT